MGAFPSVIGTAIFVGIKFAGYTQYAKHLEKSYSLSNPSNPYLFGTLRTIVGICSGALLVFVVSHLELTRNIFFIYAALAPIRIIEWLLMLSFFYESKSPKYNFDRLLKYSLIGTAISFVLDLLSALVIIIAPGSTWTIC